jgi:putative oxidoreductase
MPMHIVLAEPTRTDLGLLLLRLTAGGFLLPHGLGKLFGWFGGPGLSGFATELRGFGLPASAPLPLLLSAMQILAGLCVVLGLCTPVAAVLGAAFLAFTAALNRERGWFWMRGGMEYPLLWTAALLAVALLGSGQWSLDAVLFGHTRATP